MAEIADAIINGDLCQDCHCPLPKHGDGFPRRCIGCQRLEDNAKAPTPVHQAHNPPKPGPLPKWKTTSGVTVVPRYHCTQCKLHFATLSGADQHVADVHGVKP